MTVALNDRELDEYFTALFEMYPTAGWQKLIEDMGRLREITNDMRACQDGNEMYFRQGQLDIIDQILTHQSRAEAAYQHALREQEGGAIEITVGGQAKVVRDGEPE